jgi:hypothetical protein
MHSYGLRRGYGLIARGVPSSHKTPLPAHRNQHDHGSQEDSGSGVVVENSPSVPADGEEGAPSAGAGDEDAEAGSAAIAAVPLSGGF